MDPDVKQRWVAALRSGQYQQGFKALRIVPSPDSFAYCCLGVLCEVTKPGWLDEITTNEDNEEVSNADFYAGSVNPDPVEAARISYEEAKRLAARNDGGVDPDDLSSTRRTFEPHTFDEIATYIERTL